MLYATYLKRPCDIVAGTALVVLLAPVMAVVAIAVRMVLGSPVFHHDERAGHACDRRCDQQRRPADS